MTPCYLRYSSTYRVPFPSVITQPKLASLLPYHCQSFLFMYFNILIAFIPIWISCLFIFFYYCLCQIHDKRDFNKKILFILYHLVPRIMSDRMKEKKTKQSHFEPHDLFPLIKVNWTMVGHLTQGQTILKLHRGVQHGLIWKRHMYRG